MLGPQAHNAPWIISLFNSYRETPPDLEAAWHGVINSFFFTYCPLETGFMVKPQPKLYPEYPVAQFALPPLRADPAISEPLAYLETVDDGDPDDGPEVPYGDMSLNFDLNPTDGKSGVRGGDGEEISEADQSADVIDFLGGNTEGAALPDTRFRRAQTGPTQNESFDSSSSPPTRPRTAGDRKSPDFVLVKLDVHAPHDTQTPFLVAEVKPDNRDEPASIVQLKGYLEHLLDNQNLPVLDGILIQAGRVTSFKLKSSGGNFKEENLGYISSVKVREYMEELITRFEPEE
jgi:hypothetical protein